MDVICYNHDKLDQEPGDIISFMSEDCGDTRYLKTCNAPLHLHVKEGCKVIIIRNLDNGLVNGMEARVISVDDETISIQTLDDERLHHNLKNRTFKLDRYNFIERDAKENVVASRNQFPLRLGYAITVNKSQGRSIDHLTIDAYNFWKAGQFGVAVGRAVNKKGLRILNFNNFAATLKHSSKVYEFYQKFGAKEDPNFSCCEFNFDVNECVQAQFDFDEEFPNLAGLTEPSNQVKKCPLNIHDLLLSLCKNCETEYQEHKKHVIQCAITSKSMVTFVRHHYNYICSKFESYRVPSKGKSCNWCFLWATLHQYFASTKYINLCKKAWYTTNLTEMQNSICTKICVAILEEKAAKEASVIKKAQIDDILSRDVSISISPAFRGSLCYVAGATIHNLCKKLRMSIVRNISDSCKRKMKYECLKILHTLRIPAAALEENTKYLESVEEVLRREGRTQSLFHISDSLLDLFEIIFKKCIKFQNMELMKYCKCQ